MAQTGVQILFAFLLSPCRSPPVRRTSTPTQRDIYVITLLLSVVTAGLLVAPAAVHRVHVRAGP